MKDTIIRRWVKYCTTSRIKLNFSYKTSESSSQTFAIFGIVASQLHVFRQTEKWSNSESAEKARSYLSQVHLSAGTSSPFSGWSLHVVLLSAQPVDPLTLLVFGWLVALRWRPASVLPLWDEETAPFLIMIFQVINWLIMNNYRHTYHNSSVIIRSVINKISISRST